MGMKKGTKLSEEHKKKYSINMDGKFCISIKLK
jgi:hypothetical protein